MFKTISETAQRAVKDLSAAAQGTTQKLADGAKSTNIHSPLPTNLADECVKAAEILKLFVSKSENETGFDNIIPLNVLAGAKGLAIFTVIKAGMIWSGRAGSGLVVARLPDDKWSAPSCIAIGGVGFGAQIGADITDFVIILNTEEAVKAFSKGGNLTLGGNLSISAGPIGAGGEAALSVDSAAAIFSYSKSKGLFAGVSVEGTMLIERKDANSAFYGQAVKAGDLLSGVIPSPQQAKVLYDVIAAGLARD